MRHASILHVPHSILGATIGPVSLALACLLEQPDDPWLVASSEPTTARTLQEYGLRFNIEETFRDEKSGSYQLQISRLATPDALERLLLILALATLHLTSLGTGVVQADKRRWVDPHWRRGLSYLQLGWRWQRQQSQRGWQAFAPFRLDPAPDPFPVLTSHRVALREYIRRLALRSVGATCATRTWSELPVSTLH